MKIRICCKKMQAALENELFKISTRDKAVWCSILIDRVTGTESIRLDYCPHCGECIEYENTK